MPEEFLSRINPRVRKHLGLISFVAAALIWISGAIQTHQIFYGKLFIGLSEVIISRIGIVLLFFIGRYLLFPRIRYQSLWKWSFSLFFFLNIGAHVLKTFEYTRDWLSLILLLADIVISSCFLAGLAEVIAGVFRYWYSLSDEMIRAIDEYWRNFWKDAFKLGLLLTLGMSLAYYYFISFYLVDTALYSYILLLPVIGGGLSLFATVFTKMRNMFQQEINTIDLRLAPFLYEYDPETHQVTGFLPLFQYLLLTRSYLHELKKPFLSISGILWYLLFSGIILILPYLLVAVVQV